MYCHQCKNWSEFKDAIGNLKIERSDLGNNLGYISDLLFRGQADANWDLLTTLDRTRDEPYSLSEYYRHAGRVKSQIESLFEYEWEDVDYDKIVEFEKSYDPLTMSGLPNYSYLLHLRHHGFPSPLLDWSRSAYIASYFAFCSTNSKVDNIAVFVLQEHVGHGKLGGSEQSMILRFGPHVRTHRRHVLQQGIYTTCAKFNGETWTFAKHEDGFNESPKTQDVVWKFLVPTSERVRALTDLDSMNINHFSLFQSEDALMETLSMREFVLRPNGNRPY